MTDPSRLVPRRIGPWTALALVALITAVGAVLALGLPVSTGVDTLVSSSTADYQATQLDGEQFGSSAVIVMVKDPLSSLLTERQLTRVSELEACLDGQQLAMSSSLGSLQPVAAGKAKPYGGSGSACGTLMHERPAKAVYGPGTFLNHAVAAVNGQISAVLTSASATVTRAEAEARKLAAARGEDKALQSIAAKAAGEAELDLQLKSLGGLASEVEESGSLPSISSTTFLDEIVYGSTNAKTRGGGTRFTYLFPSSDAALIQVRLRAGLSDAQQAAAIKLIRAAVDMPRFRLSGGSYTVTGEPVVLADVASGITGQLLLLLAGAVVVMGLVLLLIFRRRLRLMPLVIALCAAAVTFGLSAVVGASLTMASIAVLPVLIGLAVDYAVQLQSGTARVSVAVAGVATAAGFLALLLSPVPMVRGFGLLLVAGVIVALVIARVVVAAAPATILTIAPPAALEDVLIGAGAILGELWWGAAGILRDGFTRLRPRRRFGAGGPGSAGVLALLTRRPLALITVAVIVAAGGWVLDARTPVQSDITKLVPSNMPALLQLDRLERVTGSSGEIDVLVHAGDVATPKVIDWMIAYEQRMTSHFGYSSSGGCAHAALCPALSLPDLLGTGTSSGSAGSPGSSSASGSSSAGKTGAKSSSAGASATLTQTSIDALLGAIPTYFKQAVITSDRRYATLAFGIRLMPLTEQRTLIAYMRAHLDPPHGVTAQLAGLPVLGADADASLSSSGRRVLTVALGLLLVALVLLAVFRDVRRALVPLVPIVLATGWSALIVYLLGIPLNPLSATLGALVIAISTEFSVLLAERVRHARGLNRSLRAGGEAADGRALRPLDAALQTAYRTTGVAIVTSGITVIVGFGVLVLSNITMLSEFGLVTLIDLTVSLVGVLAILPAVLAVSDIASLRRSGR